MKNIRIIKFSNESGSKEGVFFTEDLSASISDIIPTGLTIDSDNTISVLGFPDSFPTEYILWRE